MLDGLQAFERTGIVRRRWRSHSSNPRYITVPMRQGEDTLDRVQRAEHDDSLPRIEVSE